MRQATNTPYVKRYHKVDGVTECGNPITKENPYINDGSNRVNRKMDRTRHMSNRKGANLIIHKDIMRTAEGRVVVFFAKLKKVRQYVNEILDVNRHQNPLKTKRTGKSIEHSVLVS